MEIINNCMLCFDTRQIEDITIRDKLPLKNISSKRWKHIINKNIYCDHLNCECFQWHNILGNSEYKKLYCFHDSNIICCGQTAKELAKCSTQIRIESYIL